MTETKQMESERTGVPPAVLMGRWGRTFVWSPITQRLFAAVWTVFVVESWATLASSRRIAGRRQVGE
jgi:hypothetical protein